MSASKQHSSDTLPMRVKNMRFFIDRMGMDCAPLQFVRELTQNALEGILALPDRTGEVRWDVDWNAFDLTGTYKLCVIDTGIGMTGDEMVEYINHLSSSMHEQSSSGNYGVGAKFSAAPRNRRGLVYLSWKGGVGYQVCLWQNPQTQEYGLKRFDRPDGTTDYWAYVDDELKPDPIKDHGTMVVLLGNADEEDTLQPSEGVAMPSRWILRYLNSRYFSFPKGVTVSSREGWTNPRGDKRHNFLRQVSGMQPWLEKIAATSGTVKVAGAKAHWWILKPKSDLDTDAGHYAPGGHMAALYQNELYELRTSRAGVARLQEFGIIFGASRVVVYVEPDSDSGRPLTSNTARTMLLLDGDVLPWSEWATEFRENMPQEIVGLMEEIASGAGPRDHRAAILDRLQAIRDLFKFSRYRLAKEGHLLLADQDLVAGGRGHRMDSDGVAVKGGAGGSARGREPSGNIYALFQADKGQPGKEVRSLLEPKVDWITVEDGTRTPGDLEDRAARYLPSQHRLLINADFRVFQDMVGRWTSRYVQVKGARATVDAVAREWFEQQLVEAILGAHALRQATSQWTSPDLENLWGEEALTAVVLPRYHVDVSIKRALGSKLGSLKETVG